MNKNRAKKIIAIWFSKVKDKLSVKNKKFFLLCILLNYDANAAIEMSASDNDNKVL